MIKEVRDKVRIQIEITNACNLSCTNCYKFVGHHRKPYFMELEAVKKAIDSLEGYLGQFGITGGEPTLHPEFAEICKYLRKEVPPDQRYLQTTGYRWKEYKGIIKRTFADRVEYNDHKDLTQMNHPMLVAINDVVADESLRSELIDKCWARERWSAVINAKGCFSCEVAGTFDVLHNGPGGHAVEKGWWMMDHEHFNEQLERYCGQCGGALPQSAVTIDNNEDHASISHFTKLKELQSPKLRKNRVSLVSSEFSIQDIQRNSENWEPWRNKGIEGTEKDVLKLYGPMSGISLKGRQFFRFRSTVFSSTEKLTGRLLWRMSRVFA